jgi:hypothetical protein
MGNSESREQNESVRIANETEIPLVYVISMMNPLYWGVIQPGQSVTRQTGRVWVTVSTFPYTGLNEPDTAEAVLGIVLPTLGGLIGLAAGGPLAAVLGAEIGLTLDFIILHNNVPDANERETIAVNVGGTKYKLEKDFVQKCDQCLNEVKKVGHYANGDWLHVRKGIKKGVPYQNWEPMVFEG